MAGPMDSVGRAARHGLLLEVECRHCWHRGHHKAGEVAKIVGFNKPLEGINFKCSQCGRKDVTVKTMVVDIDRPPRVTVWMPVKFKP